MLMIESVARGSTLRYHQKKLVLIYSVMRHFAEELREAGWEVDYHYESPDFAQALAKHIEKYNPRRFLFMEQSEYAGNDALKRLIGRHQIEITPHSNFISLADDFERLHSTPDARVTMDRFYRLMRKKTGLLMDGDEPFGGQWSFDKDNRKPPDKELCILPAKRFPPDKVTTEVIKMVRRNFADHPGTCEDWIYAVTRKEALLAAEDFFEQRLDQFGPYQDAMLDGEPFLNHSVLAPYINTCLLHPLELCQDAERRYLKKRTQLASTEGFVRQVIGWREFVWRVYWRLMPDYKKRNTLGANEPLPEFFWTGKTKMRCLHDVLSTVRAHGYAHHIARLMLLGNFALTAGLNPQETNDWFASMFVDGYDWVMVPNVIGMALHADGGYVGTKPYAASANYINRMSNYCSRCPFDAKSAVGEKACPFNTFYWDFLIRNEKKFLTNPRMSLVMKALNSKDENWKQQITSKANSLRSKGFQQIKTEFFGFQP